LASGGYTIKAFVVPLHAQPVVIGLMGSVFTVASIAGPLLGGVFTSAVSWRWCFYINLPIGGITIFCLLVFFRTPVHAKSGHGTQVRQVLASFDGIGLVLMFSGVFCFFLAVQWGGVSPLEPWNSATEIGLLVGCILLFIVFTINEWYQGDRALVVFRILGTRSIGARSGFIFLWVTFSVALISSAVGCRVNPKCSLNAANIALQYTLPIYFQAIQDDTAVQSGIKMVPSISAMGKFQVSHASLMRHLPSLWVPNTDLAIPEALATGVGSGIIGKLQIFQPFLVAGAAIAAIGTGLIYTSNVDVGLGSIIGYQILYGAGTGLGVQTPNLVATVMSSAEDVSIAVATVSCKGRKLRVKHLGLTHIFVLKFSCLSLADLVSQQQMLS
jgi:MFS transporter, DHA2 family, glioxin efflux transporter